MRRRADDGDSDGDGAGAAAGAGEPRIATLLTPGLPVEAQLRTMLDTVDATIALFDAQGRLVAFNRHAQERALRFYGRPLELGRPFPNPAFESIARRALAGEVVSERRGPESRDAGVEPYWVDLRVVPVRGDDGAVVGACYHSVDVSDAVLREQERSRAEAFRRALLELTHDLLAPAAADDLHRRILDLALTHVPAACAGSVFVKGADQRYRAVASRGYDHALLRWLEVPAEHLEAWRPPATAVVDRTVDSAGVAPALEPEIARLLREALRLDQPGSTLSVPIRVGGDLVAYLSLDVHDADGAFGAEAIAYGELLASQSGALLQRLALEASLQAERERLEHLAHHDPLTGLANRTLMGTRLALTLARDRREGMITALYVIDLDGFKAINDRYGHAAGDELLLQVGAALRDGVRAGDTVARWGGDEYAVLAGGVRGRAGVRALALSLRERITAALLQPPSSGAVRASIGVALASPEDRDGHVLLQRADLAMYRAKRSGGDRIVYDDDPSGDA